MTNQLDDLEELRRNSITVAKLIEKLQTLPPDASICSSVDGERSAKTSINDLGDYFAYSPQLNILFIARDTYREYKWGGIPEDARW